MHRATPAVGHRHPEHTPRWRSAHPPCRKPALARARMRRASRFPNPARCVTRTWALRHQLRSAMLVRPARTIMGNHAVVRKDVLGWECRTQKSPKPNQFGIAIRVRNLAAECDCYSGCAAPCPSTRDGVGRCHPHAPRLPVRTYDQVQQTRLRLCARPQGAPRSVLQPHAGCSRQDPFALPYSATGRTGPAADRCRS